jgi:hypothetical protein
MIAGNGDIECTAADFSGLDHSPSQLTGVVHRAEISMSAGEVRQYVNIGVARRRDAMAPRPGVD